MKKRREEERRALFFVEKMVPDSKEGGVGVF